MTTATLEQRWATRDDLRARGDAERRAAADAYRAGDRTAFRAHLRTAAGHYRDGGFPGLYLHCLRFLADDAA